MSPLFGGRKPPPPVLPQLPARQLLAMPVTELAVLILSAWATGEIPIHWRDGELAPSRFAALLTGQPEPFLFQPTKPFASPLDRATAEAIQALEQAGLLLRTFSSESGSLLSLTRRGEQALAEGTTDRYLRIPGE